jgi:hypothetical protein
VIAEVYALHIALVALTLLLLLQWARTPSHERLVAFFAVYALGFGNHLSMILLLPGYALFLLLSAPGGWRALAHRASSGGDRLRRRRALQYAGICGRCGSCRIRRTNADALARFWFDVTKSIGATRW